MKNLIKYIGKKEVQAERMNEFQAVELGYARPNEDNHEWREGFHVIYPDGYHSWSPLNTFMDAYKPAETFVDRLRIEYSELEEKIGKLKNFLDEQDKGGTPLILAESRRLMDAQYHVMTVYRYILQNRLQRAENIINMNCCSAPEDMTNTNCCSKSEAID